MHKAKAFFFVCAGIFLLALSYHLGARNAVAQTANFRVLGPYSVMVGSTVYVLNASADRGPIGWIPAATALGYGVPPVPQASIVAYGFGNVITESGDGWVEWASGWQSYPLPGGGTATQGTSWGSVKSRYRGERGAAQPTTQDR